MSIESQGPKPPVPCTTVEALYGVLVDVERRIHAVRVLIGNLDPKTKLQLVEDGVGGKWVPPEHLTSIAPAVCNVCRPGLKWPPYQE